MAKSSRGGNTAYEKQNQVINQFNRINRKAEFEKRNQRKSLYLTTIQTIL